jgi:hypothetical protein
MPKLRIGCPLVGDFSDRTWCNMTVFDARHLSYSVLVGGILAVLAAIVWRNLDSTSLPLGNPSGIEIFSISAILIISHEALHFIFFPGAGLNANSVIGIWIKIASPYVQYLSPMSRNRFMFVLVMPFFIISIFPLFLLSSGIEQNFYMSWIAVLNCLGAGSDIFIFCMMFAKVPSDAVVLESDGKLFWAH